MEKTVIIDVNSNFHHIAGENLFEKKDIRFREYREKWREYPERFHVGKFPLFIDVEVTSECNLKCPFCATTFRSRKIPKGYMSLNTVKRIVDEGSDNNLYGVKFNIRGEPLLHPQIHEFIEYAKQKGFIDVYFNTNAMFLSEEMSWKLIESGLDRLSISFEGYSKEVYEKHRVGSEFEIVLKNIGNLQSLKKKMGVQHPKIRVQTVMLPDLKDTFEEYKKFWSDRADEVGFLDYKEMKIKKRGGQYPWACPQIWQRMAIWWDGTILPCNHDDDGVIAVGNLNEGVTLKQAWNSEKLNNIRDLHKNGMAHKVSACDGCYLRDSEILKLMEKEERHGSSRPDGKEG